MISPTDYYLSIRKYYRFIYTAEILAFHTSICYSRLSLSLSLSHMADAPQVPDNLIPQSPTLASDPAGETQRFMQHVYAWMAVALVISGGVAYYVVHDSILLSWIFEKGLFMPLLLVELALVFGLSWFLQKMSAMTATIMFILYSFTTGLTLSVIFLVYELGSIVSIFGVTAAIFTAMSVYGYYTKRDLTGIGTLAFFGLIGIIIA
jgi:FtsH-binding integral membrane protein